MTKYEECNRPMRQDFTAFERADLRAQLSNVFRHIVQNMLASEGAILEKEGEIAFVRQEFSTLNRGAPTVIAIEGGSAAGKTTVAASLEEIFDCNVFHMDDFFLRPEQRTRERYLEIGGNVDRERFLEEVLIPTVQRREVCYRRFDCATQTIEPPIAISPKCLTVVEGAYSMHPLLAPYYDFSIFLEIDPESQRNRILKRNSEQLAKRFFEEWIPMEQAYFEGFDVRAHCDMVLSTV